MAPPALSVILSEAKNLSVTVLSYAQNHGEILRFAQNDSKRGWSPQDPQLSALFSMAGGPGLGKGRIFGCS
jgi:hypothetical protein